MGDRVYDLLILGAGPAGITAAVYAARKKLDFIVLTIDIGGQAAVSWDIENYTGYQFITGPELISRFQEHLDSFGIELNKNEEVTDIIKQENLVKTITSKGEYLSKSVIVATGKRSRQLNAQGEEEFRHKGVTYCATCDGPLFKGKDVAIIGGGNSAFDAALQLIKISPKVHMVDIANRLAGDPVMIEKVRAASNVEIHSSSRVKKIYGNSFVEGIEIEKQGKVMELAVKGVFIEIGLIPNSEFVGILTLNEHGEIKVDSHNRTNIDGMFAAGDVTDVPEKQIIIACGEGSKACLSVFNYLSTHKFKK